MSQVQGRLSSSSLSPKGPKILVNGIVVRDGPEKAPEAEARKKPRFRRLGRLPFVAFLTMALGLLVATFLTACAGTSAVIVRKDGSLGVKLDAAIPGPLASRLRKLSSIPEGISLFDFEGSRKAAAGRKDVRLFDLSAPGPDSISASLEVPSLADLLAQPDLAKSGIVSLEKTASWTELRLHLERGKIGPLVKYAPGIDQDLLESLSPPALDPDPVTTQEYRDMLAGILGEKAVASLAEAYWTLEITAPGKVLEAKGGSLSGQTLKVRLPIMDLLVLEKPLDLSLRWAN